MVYEHVVGVHACSIPYEGGVGKVSNQSSIENNSVELKTERNNGKTENK